MGNSHTKKNQNHKNIILKEENLHLCLAHLQNQLIWAVNNQPNSCIIKQKIKQNHKIIILIYIYIKKIHSLIVARLQNKLINRFFLYFRIFKSKIRGKGPTTLVQILRLYLNVVAVHEVVEDLDGEVDGAARQLQLLRHYTRPVDKVTPNHIFLLKWDQG